MSSGDLFVGRSGQAGGCVIGLEEAVKRNKNGKPASSMRMTILLAVAPHVMYGLMNVLGEIGIVRGARWFIFAMIGALVGVMVIAWRRRWPLWSASWAGYALLYAYFTSSFALGSLFATVQFDFGLVLLPLMIMLGVYIFQRRPLYGLLASFPLFVLMGRLFVFELVLGGTWIFAGVWLLAALVSGAIVSAGTIRRGVLLAAGFHLISGIAFALGRSYLPYRWPEIYPRQAPTWQELVNDFVPITLALIALTLALLLLHQLKRLVLALGDQERRHQILLLTGIVATFGGRFGLNALGTDGGVATVIAGLALGLGLAVSLFAALLLARAARRKMERPAPALVLPFLAAFAPLVVFSLATPFAPDGSYSAAFQRALILSYAGVLLWVGVALWVLLQPNQNTRFLREASTGPRNQSRNRMSQTRSRA